MYSTSFANFLYGMPFEDARYSYAINTGSLQLRGAADLICKATILL
jgi:hypothetical protein